MHIEAREPPLSAATLGAMLALQPFIRRHEGELAGLRADLADLPGDLAEDIAVLASRFAALMNTTAVRIRIERVDSNTCKNVHTDYTDVRLITTYAGPGTDYAPHGDGDCCLERLQTGAVALFKGRTYAADHPACPHRSPPIAGTGASRLVLVIDTPMQDQR